MLKKEIDIDYSGELITATVEFNFYGVGSDTECEIEDVYFAIGKDSSRFINIFKLLNNEEISKIEDICLEKYLEEYIADCKTESIIDRLERIK